MFVPLSVTDWSFLWPSYVVLNLYKSNSIRITLPTGEEHTYVPMF